MKKKDTPVEHPHVPSSGATPDESSVGGPLRGIQRDTAGQAEGTPVQRGKEKTDD